MNTDDIQMTIINKRNKLIVGILIGIFGFRIFANMPIPYVREVEAVFILFMLLFVCFRYLLVPLHDRRIEFISFELYILVMMLLPFYSALQAYLVFGQPIIYGILTQRSIWVSAIALIAIYYLRQQKLTIDNIEKSFLFIAWCSLVLYIAVIATIDPARYPEYRPSFVSGSQKNGYYFKFEHIPLIFGFLYYLIRGIIHRSSQAYFKMLPFLLFLLIYKSKRSLLFALVLSVVWTFWRYLRPARILQVLFGSSLALGLALVVVIAVNPDPMNSMINKIGSAVFVVITGEPGDDVSSNARIVETATIIPYIKDRWFLGNGDISDQWGGGYLSLFKYFYPADIGIIGSLFIFGLVGLILLYGQVLFLIRSPLLSSLGKYSIIGMTSYAMFFTLLLQSLIKGGIIFAPSGMLLFLTILVWLKMSTNKIIRVKGI